MLDDQPTFGVSERLVAGTTVVELSGELDILAEATISRRLEALAFGPHPDLILDMRGVTFIDCSGLSILCQVRNRVLERAGWLAIVNADPRFLKLLRLTRLTRVFEVFDDLASALTQAPAHGHPVEDNGAIA